MKFGLSILCKVYLILVGNNSEKWSLIWLGWMRKEKGRRVLCGARFFGREKDAAIGGVLEVIDLLTYLFFLEVIPVIFSFKVIRIKFITRIFDFGCWSRELV